MRCYEDNQRGFALISALIALAILMALLVPFLASVMNESNFSDRTVQREINEQNNEGLRDRLLFLAGLRHASAEMTMEGGTPDWDDRTEYPVSIPLPESWQQDKDVLTSSSIADVQRKLHLPTLSPLVIGNLLDLATSLAEDHASDTETITVKQADSFPEENGSLFVHGERIGYATREGNVFYGLRRQWDPAPRLPADCLVLDYRCVQAITWQFERAGRRQFVPYSSVKEVAGMGGPQGAGRFTKREMDVLLAHCTTYGQNDFAGEWGKPVRVFSGQDPATQTTRYSIRTKSALGIGGGSVVKITSIENPKLVEYNFVWSTKRPQSRFGVVNLQSNWQINLLFPPSGGFQNMEAKVQPLIPVAVNLNTAGKSTLVAILKGLRKGPTQNQDHASNDPNDMSRRYGQQITEEVAQSMAAELIALRSTGDQGGGEREGKPFQGFTDLCQRFFHPMGEEANRNKDGQSRQMLTMLLLNMLYGRSPAAEMGTMPICFASSSLVSYRVASLKTKRGRLEMARREVEGVATVMPGHRLDTLLYRQRDWLDNIRLTRRSPRWLTFPISLGSIPSSNQGNDPAEIAPGLLYAKFFPTAGFGNVRFPSQEQGHIRAGTATTPWSRWNNARGRNVRGAHEQFRFSPHPDGRDLAKQGKWDMINTGPRGQGGQRQRPRHPDASFAFTADNQGMPGRHAVAFWFRLDSVGNQCLYDLAAEIANRNRINLRIEAGNLMFEVFDEAGIDPNPSETQTQVQRTAGLWKVPIADVNLQPKIWYHVNISADGNRADQLSLFLDGVPRSKPEYVTYTTAEIPVYTRPAATVTPANDKNRYPEISVKSTDGFPPQGVLRIGRELFEYTSKTSSSFVCRPMNSMGERKARQGWREFNDILDKYLDKSGRPTIGENDPAFGDRRQEKVPAIPSGVAVELYGYAAAIYRNRPIAIGSTTLRDTLGAFAVARAVVKSPVVIEVPSPNGQQSFRLGRGIGPKMTDDILLHNPVPDKKGSKTDLNPKPADEIMAAFPTSGGYALLIQQHYRWTVQANNASGEILTGGIELIKYGSRKGNALSGIERGAKIPGTAKFFSSSNNRNGRYTDGASRQFVVDWAPYLMQQVGNNGGGGSGGSGGGGSPQAIPLRQLQRWVLYVVPISIPVANGAVLNDPAETQTTEWAQIYPGKGTEENTEWVRYDVITPGHHLCRARPGAWNSLYHRLMGASSSLGQGTLTNGGGTVGDQLAKDIQFEPPQDDGIKRIGYIDKVETDWPIAYAARRALQFRGDTFTRTTSHQQNSGAVVVPCHRLEIDWGRLGALSARCGRNDRVAMVGGTKASGDSRPPLEWHTINWYTQRRNGDSYNKVNRAAQPGAALPELWGDFPFQLVAFKTAVNDVFVGPARREDLLDTRRVDRVVKFPSGEMPAAYVRSGWFGGASKSIGDYQDASGLIDEVRAVPKSAHTTLLNTAVTADAMEIPVRKHTLLFSYGTVGTSADVTQTYPRGGGLLMIDQEIVAYASYSNAIFKVAQQGRGLLGTEAKPHAEAARVQFLPHVPAAILAGGVSASTNQLVVQHLGALPRHGGTVLMGQEMLHYTWTVKDQMLGMPNWYDPEQTDPPGVGLFRGRYGTPAQSGASGSAVIWMPTRFWDRYHERSDDPELGYYQVTRRETPVFFAGVRWTVENPATAFLKLHATVNIDRAGSFRDDPKKVPGMFSFEKGTVDDKPNKIGWQGSLFELRFATEYRPGAFDPVQFLANGWKQALNVRDFGLTYEGQSRILEEATSTR